MRRPVLILPFAALLALPVPAQEGPQVVDGAGEVVVLPSGHEAVLQDVIWNVPGPEGMALRFRFVTPAIAPGGGLEFEAASEAMQYLCDSYALPRVAEFGPAPAQIVISLSDVAVPFGEAAPEAVQYFESYRIEDGACQWEMF
ncbi:DUF6497 family protein [Tabrizicola sp. TH137]|uniref:DUF6497 family protein n=1 Tax=Tabrizicola sp. TH137 TaxID=2067452 RepID=UPI0020B43177|nr:DUF6497 family protein [Tabrizicola sp. TH137]